MSDKQKLLSINDAQKKALAIATIIALLTSVIFLRQYLMLVAIAAIVAYLFHPFYLWLMKKGFKEGTSRLLTFLVTLLFIIIPLLIVIALTISQVNTLVHAAQSGSLSDFDYSNFLNNMIGRFNDLMSRMGLDVFLTAQDINSWISTVIAKAGTTLLNNLASSVTGIFGMITSVIIYIYVFLSILKNQKYIIETTGYINPLGEDITKIYIRKMGSMTKAMVRGQFIIAICQGLWSAIMLYLVGFHHLFFFFFVILTIFSFIPLGAGIITIPLGIVMILFGDVWQGAVIILNHILIVTNIDNVLRPTLVPSDARLDPALTMLSVFGGMAVFGFPGIVLGPVLMIVIVTTVQMFLEVFRSIDSLNEDSTKKKSIWGYLTSKLPSPLKR
mgnify:CR=1 FL=1